MSLLIPGAIVANRADIAVMRNARTNVHVYEHLRRTRLANGLREYSCEPYIASDDDTNNNT